MRVHANAKLGPAGRLALVELIEGGCSLRTAADESSVSVATAHRWWHRWLDADAAQRASGVWLRIVRVGRIASRDAPARRSRRGSAPFARPRAGGRGWSPAPRASRTRRSGECSRDMASLAVRGPSATPRTATSGPARAICCTWTSAPTALPPARASRHRRALPARPALDGPRHTGRQRLRARDHR